MVRVTETDDPDAQLVLIVDNNPMGTMRLSQVFTQKGWRIEICEDGDLTYSTAPILYCYLSTSQQWMATPQLSKCENQTLMPE